MLQPDKQLPLTSGFGRRCLDRLNQTLLAGGYFLPDSAGRVTRRRQRECLGQCHHCVRIPPVRALLPFFGLLLGSGSCWNVSTQSIAPASACGVAVVLSAGR
jgi:hypothetical protein